MGCSYAMKTTVSVLDSFVAKKRDRSVGCLYGVSVLISSCSKRPRPGMIGVAAPISYLAFSMQVCGGGSPPVAYSQAK